MFFKIFYPIAIAWQFPVPLNHGKLLLIGNIWAKDKPAALSTAIFGKNKKNKSSIYFRNFLNTLYKCITTKCRLSKQFKKGRFL